MTTYQQWIGIDIAATSFTMSRASARDVQERATTFAQTPDGFAACVTALHASGCPAAATLVVMEATGSYWVALAVHLHHAGYAVSVINPAKVHQYAASLTRRSKTDALDAQLLAHFARERQPPPWTPPPQVYYELQQRLVARDGVIAMRQQARNQLHALQQWPVVIASVREHLEQVLTMLDGQVQTLDAEIAQVLAAGAWAESATLLTSIPGIGLITSAWLLVATLNFSTTTSAASLAAYAGLVPLTRESGSSVRGRARIGRAGHTRLRTALYLATLTAARYNPVIMPHYERLRAAGKPSKVARCAAARKLVQVAYAVVTKRRAFDPTYQQPRQHTD